MKPPFFLLFASLAFVLDQITGLLMPGYFWFLPIVVVYYVVTQEHIERSLWVLMPIVLLTDFFSGLVFGACTLVFLIVAATVLFLTRMVQINTKQPVMRWGTTIVCSAEFFLIIRYVFT